MYRSEPLTPPGHNPLVLRELFVNFGHGKFYERTNQNMLLKQARKNTSHNLAAEESVFELFILIRGHLGKVLIREMRSNIQNYNNGLFVMPLIMVCRET